MITHNEEYQAIADSLGIKFDGVQDWFTVRILVGFTILTGPAEGASFYLNEAKGPVTFEAVQAKMFEKVQAFAVLQSA